MAKNTDNTPAVPEVEATEAPKSYKVKFKNGAKQVVHPVLGIITLDHLNGARKDRFAQALKNCDKNGDTKRFIDTNIEGL